MRNEPTLPNDDQPTIDALIAEFMIRVDDGEPLSSLQFIKEHPEKEQELRRFFANLEGIQQAIDSPATSSSTENEIDARTRADDQPTRIGEYEILELVGRGGMGCVYKAWQSNLNRVVALKTISRSGLATEHERQRFLAEAESMAALDHSGIVRVYDAGQDSGIQFLTMAFIEGSSLSDQIQQAPLDPKRAAELVANVADAIQFSHDQGVLHRDLKPSNILLDSQGSPFVSDFGLAKRVQDGSDLTITGQILGTPSYMPPEQARGDTTSGPSADIYSLGAILFTTLTGRAPFRAATPLETLRQVTHDEPPSIRVLNRQLPVDLETICRKCLQKNPGARYESAASLAQDLRRWLDGKSILARPASSFERGLKWTRRHPALAGLILMSFATVAALSATLASVLNSNELQHALEQTDQARIAATNAQVETDIALKGEESARQRAEIAETRLEQLDYAKSISLAYMQWQAGNINGVDNLLAGTNEEYRGWEWRFLKNMSHQEIRNLPVNRTSAFAIDQSNQCVYSFEDRKDKQSESCAIRQHDLSRSGAPKEIAKRRNHRVRAAVYCEDSSSFFVSSVFGNNPTRHSIEQWSVKNGATLRTYYADEFINFDLVSPRSLAVANKQRWFAAALVEHKKIEIWDTESGRSVTTLTHQSNEPTTVDLSSDERLLAAGFSNGDVVVWSAETWGIVKTFESTEANVSAVCTVNFDPTGRQLFASFKNDVQVWRTQDWSSQSLFQYELPVKAASFDETGQRLIAAGSSIIDIHDARSGRRQSRIRGHGQVIDEAKAFGDHGLLTRGSEGSLKQWNLQGPFDDSRSIRLPLPVKSIAFNADSTRLAISGGTAKDGFASVYDVASTNNTVVTKPAASVQAVAFISSSHSGDRLATASWDHRVGVWNVRKPENHAYLDDGFPSGLECVAVEPNGKWLAACGGYRDQVVIWDLEKKSIVAKLQHDSLPQSISVSPNGKWLISADAVVRVWSTDDWQQEDVIELKNERIRCLETSHCGQFIAIGTAGGRVVIGRFSDGKILQDAGTHNRLVTDLSFHPDSTRLASCSMDGTVKVWSLPGGGDVLTLGGHAGVISTVEFSHDGHLLATGGDDGVVRIYDANP